MIIPRPSPRDGFALPAALLAMVVIGALVTGGFYVSSQEHQVSVSTDHGARAMHVAEYGLQTQLGTLTTGDVRYLSRATIHDLGTSRVMNGSSQLGEYRSRVMPLSERLYMLESKGLVARGQQEAVRRVGALVRTYAAEVPYKGAISVLGGFNRDGASRVRGEDACSPALAEPGVTALHEDSVTGLLHGQQEAISGDPPVHVEPTMTSELMNQFGEIHLDDLIASATLRYPRPPSGSSPRVMEPATMIDQDGNQVCDRAASDPDNWGEPLDPSYDVQVPECTNYFPIIHSAGDMDLATGRGQGVLIVEGDLTVAGNFQFRGVVIVTGQFIMEGTQSGGVQGKIEGTVLVHGQGLVQTPNETSGNALIHWDSCAVRDALENNLRVRPLERGWVADPARLPTS